MGRYLFSVLVALSGCACPGDENRIVHPVSWYELPAAELYVMCRETSIRGCVVSRPEGDSIYTLPVVR